MLVTPVEIVLHYWDPFFCVLGRKRSLTSQNQFSVDRSCRQVFLESVHAQNISKSAHSNLGRHKTAIADTGAWHHMMPIHVRAKKKTAALKFFLNVDMYPTNDLNSKATAAAITAANFCYYRHCCNCYYCYYCC
jgi:hypothetical protein